MIFICLEIWRPACMIRDDDELNAATEAWFEDQTEDFLFQRHRLLKRKVDQMHWSKGELYWKKINGQIIFLFVS